MKFPGICIVCKKEIKVNDVALWAKGLGIKHESCAKVTQLRCMVCGNQAGCPVCEFADNCDLTKVSLTCICKKCSDKKEIFSLYQISAIKRFPGLKA
jgi:hypothetical protein